MKKVNLPAFLIVLIIVFAIGVFKSSNMSISPTVARAGTGENVLGFAWANTPQSSGDPATGTDQGVGWISFNSLNDSSAVSYGVNVDDNPSSPTYGDFSGYAWSENIGWISFEPAGPYPEKPNYSANVNWNTGEVTGWARACVGSANPETTCIGNNSNAGGMDGWVKLSGVAVDGTSYGVLLDTTTNKFSGYAWGSDVIGWIDFSPTTAGTKGVSVGGSGAQPKPECSDNKDNGDPEDTLVDRNDPGCYADPADITTYDPNDNDEINTGSTGASLPECSDWVDNDGNGKCDFSGRCFVAGAGLVDKGSDTGCSSSNDLKEAPVAQTAGPVCGNGIVEQGEDCDPVSSSSLGSCSGLSSIFGSGSYYCYPKNSSNPCKYDTVGSFNSTGKGTCVLSNTDVCGNGVCESTETLLGCPSDCFKIGEF